MIFFSVLSWWSVQDFRAETPSRCFENEAGTQLDEIYFGVNFFQIYQIPPVFFLYVNLK